ncbi:MAG: hypothetical protein K8R48_06820 [Alphaproteobacteria bacterium]|nr:hypothetical protein [Alphaproteobacteria bacterium]
MNAGKKLSRFFKTAVLGTVLALSAGCGGNNLQPPPSPVVKDTAVHTSLLSSAPLTESEINLVHGLFGDAVNTGIVKKYFYPPSLLMVSRVPDRRSIQFYGNTCASPDYSLDQDIFKFGTFVHEMTHVWQRQTAKTDALEMCHDYYYTLNSKSHFADFCVEQQAAIMEDYARRFLHSGHQSFYAKDTPGHDLLLQKVVETQFPAARETRLAYEAQEHAKTAALKPKTLKI